MIGKAIKELLLASPNIITLFGDRIYPIMVPQTIDGLSLIFGITGVDPTHSKDASHLDGVEVTVQFYSKDYNLIQTSAQTIRTVLNKRKGTFGGIEISDSEFLDYQDAWDGKNERFTGTIIFKFMCNDNYS